MRRLFPILKSVLKQIWSIVKCHRPVHPEYHVDDVAKQAGHKVVCLPVAHSELNPIKMAWSQMKHFSQSHNKKFTLTEVERLTHLDFDEVTPERWKFLIAHIKERVEDHYLEADGLQMEIVDEFIISLEGDSDFDSDSSDSSESCDSD